MTARSIHKLLAASFGLVLLSGPAFAQAPSTSPPTDAPAAPGAPPADAPEDAPPSPAESCTVDPSDPQSGTTSDDQMLTDQLDDCESVLMPQMDGEMDEGAPVPDPDPNTTPVIPPGAVKPQQSQN